MEEMPQPTGSAEAPRVREALCLMSQAALQLHLHKGYWLTRLHKVGLLVFLIIGSLTEDLRASEYPLRTPGADGLGPEV